MSVQTPSTDDGAWVPSGCTGTAGCPPRCPRFVDKEGIPLLVRSYKDRDYDDLVTFYEGYPARHRSLSLPPATRQYVERWLTTLLDDGKHLLAVDGDTITGHVGYAPRDASVPELLVFVDEAYHDRGIGTELCRHAIAHAAADGCEGLTLRVELGNSRAVHVYERLGFRQVAEHDDNVEMRLDVDQSVADAVQAPPAER